VERQRRFGTEVEAAPIAAAQIRTLIDSIGHYVQSLNYDIETEEEHHQVLGRSRPGLFSFSAKPDRPAR
jgi:hypothetical protein